LELEWTILPILSCRVSKLTKRLHGMWLSPKPRADRAASQSRKATTIGTAIDTASITSPERRLLGL
jgi:hypothetical protein